MPKLFSIALSKLSTHLYEFLMVLLIRIFMDSPVKMLELHIEYLYILDSLEVIKKLERIAS